MSSDSDLEIQLSRYDETKSQGWWGWTKNACKNLAGTVKGVVSSLSAGAAVLLVYNTVSKIYDGIEHKQEESESEDEFNVSDPQFWAQIAITFAVMYPVVKFKLRQIMAKAEDTKDASFIENITSSFADGCLNGNAYHMFGEALIDSLSISGGYKTAFHIANLSMLLGTGIIFAIQDWQFNTNQEINPKFNDVANFLRHFATVFNLAQKGFDIDFTNNSYARNIANIGFVGIAGLVGTVGSPFNYIAKEANMTRDVKVPITELDEIQDVESSQNDNDEKITSFKSQDTTGEQKLKYALLSTYTPSDSALYVFGTSDSIVTLLPYLKDTVKSNDGTYITAGLVVILLGIEALGYNEKYEKVAKSKVAQWKSEDAIGCSRPFKTLFFKPSGTEDELLLERQEVGQVTGCLSLCFK